VAQHKHQYRFFATYGIFRGWKLEQNNKYNWDRSEGVFLYDEENRNYEMIQKNVEDGLIRWSEKV
jgi:hypothetical protein